MEPNPISQALVEAKNRALIKSDAHLRDVRRAAQRDAAADRGEIEKLTERLYQEHDSAIHQLRSAVSAIEEKSTNDIDCFNVESRCNLGQTKKNIDELLEVRKENQRLEQKLKAAYYAHDRAELRCSEAQGEIEAQRVDLVAMARQLQDLERSQTIASHDRRLCLRIKKMQTSLSEKDAMVQGLREALVKLKIEFVAAEEVVHGSIVRCI